MHPDYLSLAYFDKLGLFLWGSSDENKFLVSSRLRRRRCGYRSGRCTLIICPWLISIGWGFFFGIVAVRINFWFRPDGGRGGADI
jgi:hypothetical protein